MSSQPSQKEKPNLKNMMIAPCQIEPFILLLFDKKLLS